jgi:hypothetical protein
MKRVPLSRLLCFVPQDWFLAARCGEIPSKNEPLGWPIISNFGVTARPVREIKIGCPRIKGDSKKNDTDDVESRCVDWHTHLRLYFASHGTQRKKNDVSSGRVTQ